MTAWARCLRFLTCHYTWTPFPLRPRAMFLIFEESDWWQHRVTRGARQSAGGEEGGCERDREGETRALDWKTGAVGYNLD